MNDQNQNRTRHVGRKPFITTGRLAVLIALLLFLTQACVVNGQRSTPDLTPVLPLTQATGSAQSIEITASPDPTSSPTSTLIPTPSPTSTPLPTSTQTATSTPEPPVIFAVIGDYGSGGSREMSVADLVKSWNPDFIITTGDNNYPVGGQETIDENIGQFYHSYIFPYTGGYGDGASINRFFPSIGNHDLITDAGKPYLDYFSLPGNELYYDFVWGSVHLFAIDPVSDPAGFKEDSIQGQWLRRGLAESTSPWNIVYMHYPPYSTSKHGSTDWARWPFAEWGADAVMSGHDHTYERISVDGLTFFVNGLGGNGIYEFFDPMEGDQARYNADYGAMRVEATSHALKFEFINRENDLIDSYELTN